MKAIAIRFGLLPAAAALLAACASHQPVEPEQSQFTPGLGEIMAQTATRHAKLWFAGQAGNWDLAAYEVDELHEGFEDAAKFHPTHKEIKQPVSELIVQHMQQPLTGLEQAIKDKDVHTFTQRYDDLTVACNACHQVTAFGFNRVTRPTFNPFANQAFELAN